MAARAKHVLQQGPVLAALGKTALKALEQSIRKPTGKGGPPPVPGPLFEATVAARPKDLVRDYVRAVGGDTGAYKRVVPPHMFPQWGFPLLSKTLAGLDYPMARVLNGGCNMTINAPIPQDATLRLSAQLVDIDDNGSRAVIKQRLVTGTDAHPEALVAHLFPIVPLGGGQGGSKKTKKKKARPRVLATAREIARWRIPASAGMDFAILTGDFNPVHWIPAYAKASGFRSTILHGFATLARAYEGVVRGVFAGDVGRLARFDAKFVRPLLLPAKVGLYVTDDAMDDGGGRGVFVGDAPGGPAYMVATFG